MQRSQVYTHIDRCMGWLLPPCCVLCRRPGQRPAYDLCVDCEAGFPRLIDPCPRCGLPRPEDEPNTSTKPCEQCASVELPYSRCITPWAYEFPVTQLIQALKYENALANARILGTRLAIHARSGPAAAWDPAAIVVPMPLHPSRVVERGYNQSREIARITARQLQLQLVEPALRRVRATQPQVGLTRPDRATNLRGAFLAAPSVVAGRRVILIDDVVTTGSTATEAARTLLDAGAADVAIWAAARALGPAGRDR